MALTARNPGPRDFEVMVDGVGRFVFGYRMMRDENKIQAAYARIVDGTMPTDWLHLLASWQSAISVLAVEVPDGWNMDEMDPLLDEDYAKLTAVFEALHAKELSFRGKQLGKST